MTWTVVVGAVLVLVAVLIGALYRHWRRSASLQAQLETAAARLRNLQETCSR
jgi:Na+(H+)/acetate symporter ActP